MTSFAPDLSSSLISFETIKEYGATNLIDIIAARQGTKALFLDPSLSKTLALIISSKAIKQHNVVDFGFIDRPDSKTNCDHCIYVLRPDLHLISLVASQIDLRKRNAGRSPVPSSTEPTIGIYFVPHTSLICERYLSNLGLTMDPDIFIGEYPLDLIPIDGDILSLEYRPAFNKIFVDHDTTVLYTIARSIIHLQTFFGVIPMIKGYGTASHQVAQMVFRLTKELSLNSKSSNTQSPSSEAYDSLITLINGSVDTNSSISGVVQNPTQQQQPRGILSLSSLTSSLLSSSNAPVTSAPPTGAGAAAGAGNKPANEPVHAVNNYTVPNIAQVVLIDRAADLLTPFVTQFTYEGLIDEVIGIEHSSIEIENPEYDPKTATGANSQPKNQLAAQKTRRVTLNNSDMLFSEIRDLNNRLLGPLLHLKATNIRRVYDQRDNITSKSMSQVQEYFEKFKLVNREHLFLQIHLHIAETIKLFLTSRIREKITDAEEALLRDGNPRPCEELINQCIMQMVDVTVVYRLIALLALSTGTLSKTKTEPIVRDIVQTYGYEQLSTITAFERLGIIHSTPAALSTSSTGNAQASLPTTSAFTSPLFNLFTKGGWDKLSKALKLLVPVTDKTTLREPSDANFAFNHGYVPLSIRLVELAASHKGLTRAGDILSNYKPDIAFEYRQDIPPNIQQRMQIPDPSFFSLLPLAASENITPSVSKKHHQQQQQLLQAQATQPTPPSLFLPSTPAPQPEKSGDDATAGSAMTTSTKPICLVYFVGGATFAELSLLRYLSEKPTHKYRYVAATTSMINGNRLLHEISSQLAQIGKTY